MDDSLAKILVTVSSLVLEVFLGTRGLLEGGHRGDPYPVGGMLQDALVHLLDLADQPATKLLSLADGFPSLATGMVYAGVPLLVLVAIYGGVIAWASSSVARVHHLHESISELNDKADQITQGISALAQIYIDNSPPYTSKRGARGAQDP